MTRVRVVMNIKIIILLRKSRMGGRRNVINKLGTMMMIAMMILMMRVCKINFLLNTTRQNTNQEFVWLILLLFVLEIIIM